MSASLKWEPSERNSNTLPDALKFVLRDKCGLESRHKQWGMEKLEFLNGLNAAGIDGAQELIEAIEKFGSVDIWLEY